MPDTISLMNFCSGWIVAVHRLSLLIALCISFINCNYTFRKAQTSLSSVDVYMFVGTYSQRGSEGIYIYSFNTQTGKMTKVSSNNETRNPSYLALSGDNLYAVSETGGGYPGSVSSYKFDKKTGSLLFLNNLSAQGDGTCYVGVDETGKFVGAANYSGGSLALFKTADDGSLLNEIQFIQNSGKGFIPGRQSGPRGHQILFTPDQKFMIFTDLGLDKFSVFNFDKNEKMPLSLFKEYEKKVGSGPRHFVFHPNKKFAFLISEITSTVTVYQYDDGTFTQVQEFNTWPPRFSGDTDGAAIKVSPDGRYLYVSCRGDQNVIVCYSINQENGRLTNMGTYSVEGFVPRDFAIDPTGNFLVVANYSSNELVTFRVDKETGFLTFVSKTVVPIPSFVGFASKR